MTETDIDGDNVVQLSTESLRHVESGIAQHRAVVERLAKTQAELADTKRQLVATREQLTQAMHDLDLAHQNEGSLGERVRFADERAEKAEERTRIAWAAQADWKARIDSLAALLLPMYQNDEYRPPEKPAGALNGAGGAKPQDDRLHRALIDRRPTGRAPVQEV